MLAEIKHTTNNLYIPFALNCESDVTHLYLYLKTLLTGKLKNGKKKLILLFLIGLCCYFILFGVGLVCFESGCYTQKLKLH